jgi:hypothetical protein
MYGLANLRRRVPMTLSHDHPDDPRLLVRLAGELLEQLKDVEDLTAEDLAALRRLHDEVGELLRLPVSYD